jgi:uncharacterized protein (TIGR02996 family)
MPQREAFLKAIIDEPDDDTHRLVYADWLDDNGDEADRARAAFIRAQIELERLPDEDLRRKELEKQASDLHDAHVADWFRGFLPPQHHFRRGFVQTIRTTPGLLKQSAEALFAREPVTEWNLIRFSEREILAGEIATWPWLARFRRLDTDDSQMDEEPLATLLRSPHLTGLRELRISPYRQGTGAIKAIADNPALAGLTRLTLEGLWRNGNAVATTLAEARHLDRLTHLEFGSDGIGPEGAAALARSTILRRVTHLSFDADNSPGPRISNEGLLALLGSTHLTGLTDLTLRWQDITDESVVTLANSPKVANLVRLSLAINRIGAAGMSALAHSSYLGNLEELHLAGTAPGDDGAEALASGTALSRLRRLELGGYFGSPYHENGIGDRGMSALANCPMFAGLRVLNLERNAGIGPAGAVALASSPYLTLLEELVFEKSVLGPEGAKALAKSANLAHLRKLSLQGAKIGDAGAKALAKSPHLKNLRTLLLSDCDLRAAGARAIAESPFLQGVTYLSLYNNPLRKSLRATLERGP